MNSFNNYGFDKKPKSDREDIKNILEALNNDEEYGMVLRAKGMVEDFDGSWIHFDFTPGEADIRNGSAAPTGMLCVIGSHIDEEKIESLFGVH